MKTICRFHFGFCTCCILISGCFIFFQTPASAQTVGQATSVVLKQVTELLESGNAEQAVPYLEEMLVRLEGVKDKDSAAARAACIYQLGMCYLETKRYEEAVEMFKMFVRDYPSDESAVTARFLILEAYAWQPDPQPMKAYVDKLKASGELARLLSAFSDTKNADTYRHAALSLVIAYARSGDMENLRQFLSYCDTTSRSDVGLNLALMDGGDALAGQKDPIHALELYRFVQPSAELKASYDKRLAALKDELSKPPAWVPLKERDAQQAHRAAEQIRYDQMAEERQTLDAKNYDLDLMIRMAQCYQSMSRQWTAYLIYKHIYTGFPENPLAEQCRYFAFQSLLAMQEVTAKDEGYAYVKLYPSGRFRDEVTLSLMQLHLMMSEPGVAEKLGRDLLAQTPAHRFADQVTGLLAYIQFQRQNYESALKLYAEAAAKWPTGSYAQEAVYWTGMCNLFLARYDAAITVFEGYLSNPAWKEKTFAAEATYQLGMALYGKADYAKASEAFQRFLKQYPDSRLKAEAFSMLGDIRGADGDLAAALEFYRQARGSAASRDQDSYAVFQSERIYQMQKDYDAAVALMGEYLAKWGAKSDFTEAGSWMMKFCKAMGRYDKVLQLFRDAIALYGNDPQADSADQLIKEMVKGMTQPEQKEQLKTLLAGDLEASGKDVNRKTLYLRLTALFAEISEGAKRDAYIENILREKDVSAFSPVPLLLFAKEASARGDLSRVQMAYDQFARAFSSSDLMPDMANIQISALLTAGKYQDALALAQESSSRFDGHAKSGLTKKLAGDALRLLKNYDGAVEAYNQFLSVREWRGPLTPQVLYWTGVCRYEQGRPEEAFAFFQRVYVLYETHTEWTAKAYEGSVNCLQKLGRTDAVIKTWHEMVNNPVIAATPEGRRAQAELSKLPGGAR